ncbi:alpha-glucan family phosphorylase [Heliobacterium undosum]|uniref:glycogen phosphorylase n=1 Tax=Heliomicrobium undosum TaxID=121734 RepID=A0A845KY03_9FIRM|nr:alpha-glucan family phosphorylase [Heliomicrobium undosum]MZP28597.1 alpha-glucan family phosphorylase [Heliomicrobium undosum]
MNLLEMRMIAKETPFSVAGGEFRRRCSFSAGKSDLRLDDDTAKKPRVAYFCMEYGLDSQLPIYAGGLGVLAGDYLKAAYDLGLPMVGVGILWNQDYTHQYIGEDGRPYDKYPNFSFDSVKDTGITVKVRVRGADVTCKVHKVEQFGNVSLYLLDTNFPGSEHGWMTNRLYGGAAQDRVAAEIILGIGGIRALRALDIDVDIYHMNEGHAVFCGLELIREKMRQGMSFKDAWSETRKQIVFTTHTPVEAGNEVHDHGLLQHMEVYNGLTYEQAREIGGDPFNMTAASLRLSHIANGVSKLHGQTACRMWKDIHDAACIISITNGVHPQTWQDEGIRDAFERKGDLWEVHQRNKGMLIDYIEQHCHTRLNPDALIVGFARRAAPYKRSDLIFRSSEVIEPLLMEGKIQLVFSGKAHPQDGIGKDIIQQLVRMSKKYGKSVVFIENYNMEVARHMVRGCDVWLNNPRRPLEASGTSGMKAAMNGVLNLSVVDGWVGEGLQHRVSGWLLNPILEANLNEWEQDEKDLRELYRVLLNEVIPTYYHDRERWIQMMRASIDMSRWQFSSHRMIREYFDVMYEVTRSAQDLDIPSMPVGVYDESERPGYSSPQDEGRW